jgi:hypothetical protein
MDDLLLSRFAASFSRYDDDVADAGSPAERVDPDTLGVVTCHGLPARSGFAWRPLACTAPASALVALRAKLPGRLPPLYERLIASYRWREVDLCQLRLLANLPGEDGSLEPLAREIMADPAFVDVLFPRGLVPFGKALESYDPVCFDSTRPTLEGDCVIVRLDHEAVLVDNRVEVGEVVAASFREWVGRCVGDT